MAIVKRKRRNRFRFDLRDFPALNNNNHHVTSDARDGQNCIDYAAGDDIHFWWPISKDDFPGRFPPPYFWPIDAPCEATLEAFVVAFMTVGFHTCDDGEDGCLEDGTEKIAIFANRNEPTHAAVQSPRRNGKWRSKMGINEDIEHDLQVLVGPLYGQVALFMKRSFAERRDAAKKPPLSH